MLIAGALCGLAGVSQILGTNSQLTGDIDAGIGFDAITVALLGRANPKGIIAAGLLFGALHAGGTQMQSATGTPIDLVQVIQSLIVLFIAAPMLVRAMFRLKGPSSVRRRPAREGVERMTTTAVAAPRPTSSPSSTSSPGLPSRRAQRLGAGLSLVVARAGDDLALRAQRPPRPGRHDPARRRSTPPHVPPLHGPRRPRGLDLRAS